MSNRRHPKHRDLKQPIPIDGREWLMFRDCPESELTHCLHYEFAREHKDAKEWMQWLGRKLTTNPQFSLSDLYREFPNQTLSEYPTRLLHSTTGSFLIACREFFPDQPWLAIPVTIRQELAKKFWTTRDRLTGEETSTAAGDPELMVMDLEVVLKDPIWQRGFNYAFAIDWTQNNSRLKERFALWLKLNRPSHTEIRERRGKTSARELLKALGAWRLTEIATAEAAETHTQRVLGTEPLYSEAGSWSRQAKLAADFMLRFGL